LRTAPFWQEDISDKLLSGVLNPVDVVENWIELTEEEKQRLLINSTLPKFGYGGRFFTIYKPNQIPTEYLAYFEITAQKVLDIEKDLGLEFIISSFFRSMAHHLRVYAAKGITNPDKIPMKSTHLRCQGIDLVPVKMKIKDAQALFTEEFLVKHNIWMEHEAHTPGWIHIQLVPYPSWKPGMSRKYHI
jgi:hypothetical protein